MLAVIENDGSLFVTVRESADLPENVVIDEINAQFKNGSLIIKLPKAKEIKPVTKKIKIS